VTLARFLALIAPSGGSSGLPKEPALAADTVIALMADAANRSRLESMYLLLRIDSSESSKLGPVLVAFYPDAREQFRAHDGCCLTFDIRPLNSSLFF
jgi:hypothetical protein